MALIHTKRDIVETKKNGKREKMKRRAKEIVRSEERREKRK